MNINYKEAQFELFPDSPVALQDAERPRVLAAQLTLSAENLVISVIVAIMCLLLSFSFGVERGKKVAFHRLDVVPSGLNGALSDSQNKDSNQESVSVETAQEISVSDAVAQVAILPKSVDKDSIVASSLGSFTVQVASYKSEKTAGREADNLKQKGYRDVYVVPKGAYVIVCVGNFSTKSDAKAYTSKLKSRYQDTVVRRL